MRIDQDAETCAPLNDNEIGEAAQKLVLEDAAESEQKPKTVLPVLLVRL